jgi:hypothetical protein
MLPIVADREGLRLDLLRISYWLAWGLYERSRADPKAVRATLDDVHDKLEAALAALKALGHDAREAVGRCSKGRGIEDAVGVLQDLARWTAEAGVGVDVPRVIIDDPDPDDPEAVRTVRRPGRPRDPVAEEAMRGLVHAWERQTGKQPTITTDASEGGAKRGAFLDFSRAVIVPIYKAQGLKPPSVEAWAKKVLYPPAEGERKA